ncbi:hypothetical protein [Salinispora pacifica]|nr:hypothetical protein [Salinispora pacifica]
MRADLDAEDDGGERHRLFAEDVRKAFDWYRAHRDPLDWRRILTHC